MILDVITDNPMLAGTALVDVVVLIATVIDLQGGAVANWSHGLAMIVVVDSPERTEQLWTWLWRLTTVLVIWFVGGPLWASLAQPVRGGRPR